MSSCRGISCFLAASVFLSASASHLHAETGKKPPGAKAVRLDLHGDPLPHGVSARMGSLRFRQGGVHHLAYSADGTRLATLLSTWPGSPGQRFRVWNAQTGKLLAELHEASDDFVDALLVPAGDAAVLVGQDRQTLRLLDLATRKELRRFKLPAGWTVARPVLSGDGSVLAALLEAGSSRRMDAWRTQTGQPIFTLENLGESVQTILLSHTAQILAVSEKASVTLWDIASGKRVETLAGFWASAMSPDGAILVDGTKAGVTLRDADSGQEAGSWADGADQNIMQPVFSPDGKRVAAVGQVGVVLLDRVGTEVGRLKLARGQRTITAVAFSPDGKTLAGASLDDATIHRWDIASGTEIAVDEGHQGEISFLAFSADGKRLASVEADGTICVWDAGTGKHVQRYDGMRALRPKDGTPPQIAVRFTPQGALQALAQIYGRDGWAELWDPSRPKLLRKFPHNLVAVSADWKWCVLPVDGDREESRPGYAGLRLWKMQTGEEIASLALPENADAVPGSVVFSADGRTLAGLFHVYAKGTGGDNERPHPLSPDEHTAFNPAVQLWETSSGKERGRFAMSLDPAYQMGTPRFGVGGGGFGLGGALPTELPAGVRGMTFAPNGRHLLLSRGSHESVRQLPFTVLWDMRKNKEVRRFGAAQVFSPDGKYVAGIREDGKLAIWAVASGTFLAAIDPLEDRVTAFAFTPDSRGFAVGRANSTIDLWSMEALLAPGED
jgi:WD40 repeat protein